MAGFRVLQLIPGIGPATATRLLELISEAPEPTVVVERFEVNANVAEDWQSFVQLYRALTLPQRTWPADMELAMRWYTPHLERLHDDAPVRKGDLEQLVRMASGYSSRERFLAELTLDPPETTGDLAGPPHLDEDYLILSTIHSAKGQEWKSVHVLNVVDGCMPSDLSTGNAAEIEEERRLLYVAMTRARDHLHLIVPHRFYVTQQSASGDRHLYAPRSRFITEAMTKRFDTVVWPQATAQDRQPSMGQAQRPAVLVRDRARAAWR